MDAQEQQDQELARLDLSKVANKQQVEALLEALSESAASGPPASAPDLLEKLAMMDGDMRERWVRDAEEMGF